MLDYDSPLYARINRWDPTHLQRIHRLIDLHAGDRVLEVGCGRGHLTRRLAEQGIDVKGIDVNPKAAEIAESDRVMTMRAESLDFADESFDLVISVHALEHIPALEEALRETARVLRHGGTALHIYPAEPIKGLYAIPTSIILHGTPFKARQVHCHLLWPAKLRRLVSPFGLEETHHEFNLVKSPQFISVFEKTG
jgi:2-polyprenyl-3-methyl-5-hydroxy-6-metoxy-1,4-benzoquinol methylase